MSNEVDTCKRDFSVFTKKNFQGTILDGGSYIENLKIERQPSKKYPIFNTNQFSIDDIYQIWLINKNWIKQIISGWWFISCLNSIRYVFSTFQQIFKFKDVYHKFIWADKNLNWHYLVFWRVNLKNNHQALVFQRRKSKSRLQFLFWFFPLLIWLLVKYFQIWQDLNFSNNAKILIRKLDQASVSIIQKVKKNNNKMN